MWEKSESSQQPKSIHVWIEMWIITETEPHSRVDRKMNHYRNRTRFTCKIKWIITEFRTRFTCEKRESSQKPNPIHVWKDIESSQNLNQIYLWEKSDSSQKPNSIHVWIEKCIITVTEPDLPVRKSESSRKPNCIHLWIEKWIPSQKPNQIYL